MMVRRDIGVPFDYFAAPPGAVPLEGHRPRLSTIPENSPDARAQRALSEAAAELAAAAQIGRADREALEQARAAIKLALALPETDAQRRMRPKAHEAARAYAGGVDVSS